MSSSLRRILASRSNGARSSGPKTLEGKRRSSANATRHGLLARCLVLENESRQAFDDLAASYVARFGPLDPVELGHVEEMVASFWRLRRAWAAETRLIQNSLDSCPHGDDEIGRIASAFSDLAASPWLALLHRYETRLHLMYRRALENLLLLRTADMPNKPSPINEHSLLPALPPAPPPPSTP